MHDTSLYPRVRHLSYSSGNDMMLGLTSKLYHKDKIHLAM